MDGAMIAMLGLLLLTTAWGVSVVVRLQAYLWRRGRIVSPALVSPMVLDDLRDYRRITCAEAGRPGPLYLHFVGACLAAMASAAAVLVAALS